MWVRNDSQNTRLNVKTATKKPSTTSALMITIRVFDNWLLSLLFSSNRWPQHRIAPTAVSPTSKWRTRCSTTDTLDGTWEQNKAPVFQAILLAIICRAATATILLKTSLTYLIFLLSAVNLNGVSLVLPIRFAEQSSLKWLQGTESPDSRRGPRSLPPPKCVKLRRMSGQARFSTTQADGSTSASTGWLFRIDRNAYGCVCARLCLCVNEQRHHCRLDVSVIFSTPEEFRRCL